VPDVLDEDGGLDVDELCDTDMLRGSHPRASGESRHDALVNGALHVRSVAGVGREISPRSRSCRRR